jgi:hypothetical protein
MSTSFHPYIMQIIFIHYTWVLNIPHQTMVYNTSFH